MRTKLVAVVAAVQFLAFVHCAQAEEPRITVKALQGLTGVGVVVGGLSEDAKKIPVTERDIQDIVEQKLKTAGIKVLSREERLSAPGMPYLYLRSSIKVTGDGFVYGSVKIQIKEEACLTRKAMCSPFITWNKGSIFSVERDRAQQFLKDAVAENMDVFLKDYLSVNPVTAPVQRVPNP